MINILIVDDNKSKTGAISDLINSVTGEIKANIEIAGNIGSASKKISNTKYDLVILDLNIPLVDGKESQKDGGLRLLNNLKRQNKLKWPKKLIGLTAYKESFEKYNKEFTDDSYLLIEYSNTNTDWQKPICSIIGQIYDAARKGASPKGTFSRFEMTIICITYLVVVVSIFLPKSYTPIQSTQLFLLSAMLIAFLFGKNVQSKFKLKLPGLIFSTAGAAALALGSMVLLSNLSTPKFAIGIYEIIDEEGKKVVINEKDIDVSLGANTQRPEIFTKNYSLIVIFPKGCDKSNIHIRDYSGTINYVKDTLQILRLGKDLKKSK
jgi:CheY-like chemotaxis protein